MTEKRQKSRQNGHKTKKEKYLISQRGMLNRLPSNIFHSLHNDVLEIDRDRLALVCPAGYRYRGLGVDAVASLHADTMLEKQQEVEEARLGRIRVRYRATRDEYSRCRVLGIPGRGFCVVAREYGIAPILLCCLINKEH